MGSQANRADERPDDANTPTGDNHQSPAEEQAVCAACGHPIAQDDLVCPNCGISLVSG